jgi:magnesium transporter
LPDWIAHGILDSIVDSFFPFVQEIEKEVMDIERIVFSDGGFWGGGANAIPPNSPQTSSNETLAESEKTALGEKPIANGKEKPDLECGKHSTGRSALLKIHSLASRLRRTLPAIPPIMRPFMHLARSPSSPTPDLPKAEEEGSSTYSMLLRMARTRRLVTSLTRLLMTKSDVIAQIRKRLMTASVYDRQTKPEKKDDLEVAIYMGDVEGERILFSLESGVYCLGFRPYSDAAKFAGTLRTYAEPIASDVPLASQCHASQDKIRRGQSHSVLNCSIYRCPMRTNDHRQVLEVKPWGVLLIFYPGCFSMNVYVPHNAKEPGGKFNMFGVVVSLVLVVLTAYLFNVRRWWRRAKRTRGAVL